jgi:ribonuclease HI
VFKWKENDYRTARASLATNRLFEKLDRQVTELNDMGVEVLFWHVPHEQNREAEKLANMALDG